MSIFDLLFLLSLTGVLIGAGVVTYRFARGRNVTAATLLRRLLVFVGGYTLLLIAVSVAEPQREIPIGTAQCFDEWCVTVQGVVRQAAIGEVRAKGTFYVVTLSLSSRAKRRRQSEPDAIVYLLDGAGRRFDVSESAQRGLVAEGIAGERLDAFLDPGAAVLSRVAFDVPNDAAHVALVKASRSRFPFRWIVGDPQSWLHRPTVVPLNLP